MLVSVSGLEVRYQSTDRWVLSRTSLEQFAGQITAVIGPSGCGKSTLIHAIAGLIPHTIPAQYRGSVLLEGVELAEAEVLDIARVVGYVGQNPDTAVLTQSVFDELSFALQNLCLPIDEIHSRVEEALRAVDMIDCAHHDPWQLSGGQRQRLALAAAVAMKPKLLVLDEPTSMIDVGGKLEFYRMLGEARAEGQGVLVVDHDLDPVLPLVDRVLALDASGEVIGYGPPEEVFENNLERLRDCGVWLPRRLRGAVSSSLPEINGHAETRFFRRSGEQWREVPQLTGGDLLVVEDIEVPGRSPKVSFGIGAGELVAVVGENGSGKSSLLGALARILPSSSRRAELNGRPWRLGELGYVFQNPEHQFVTNSLRQELAFGGVPDAEVDRLLETFRLGELAEQHPLTLSGGQARRLSVATMASQQQPVVLLDEPTFGQDFDNTVELISFIEGLTLAGKSVILATHDLEFVASHATALIVLPGRKTKPNMVSVKPTAKPQSSPFHPLTMALGVLLPIAAVATDRSITTNLVVMGLSSLVAALLSRGKRRFLIPVAIWLAAGLASFALGMNTRAEIITLRGKWTSGIESGTLLGALLSLAFVSGSGVVPEALIRSLTTTFKVPYRVTSAGTAALAFLRRFSSDFRLLRTARALRGAGKRFGPFAPVARWAGAVFPLVVTAVQHGERVALTMDSRAFGAYPKKTELVSDPWRTRDTLAVVAIWATVIGYWIWKAIQ